MCRATSSTLIGLLLILAPVTRLAADDDAPREPYSFVTVAPEATQKKIRAEYGAGFRLYVTDHFRMISDSTPRYHRTVAGVLEQFYLEVYPRFFKKKMKPVKAFLIHDGRDFETFVTERGHGRNTGSYGFYVPGERALYARRYFPDGKPSGVGTLFHEVIHAMIHADFKGSPPTWFEEGFASLFEHGRIVRGKWVYGNPNPWREAKFRDPFENGDTPSLKEYMGLSDSDFRASGESNTYYNTGRSLCLYLLRQDEKKLTKFVAEIRKKRKGATALKRATGKRKLKTIEAEWRESVRKVNFGGYYVDRAQKGGGLEVLQEGVKHHPDYGFLQVRLAEAFCEAGKDEEARKHAEAALRDPHLPFPEFAYAVLGRTYWNSDKAKAAEAFRKALAFQPWSEWVLETTHKSLVATLQRLNKADEARAVSEALEKLKAEDRR